MEKTMTNLNSEIYTVQKQIDDLLTHLNDSKYTLPESIFVKHFLPYFCGEKDPLEDDKFISMWVGVAGGLGEPINILDNSGNLLFIAPSLYDTSIIHPAYNGDNNSVNKVITTAEAISSNIPSEGKRVLDKGLKSRLQGVIALDTNTISERDNRIIAILRRYNKPIPKILLDKIIDHSEETVTEDPFNYD